MSVLLLSLPFGVHSLTAVAPPANSVVWTMTSGAIYMFAVGQITFGTIHCAPSFLETHACMFLYYWNELHACPLGSSWGLKFRRSLCDRVAVTSSIIILWRFSTRKDHVRVSISGASNARRAGEIQWRFRGENERGGEELLRGRGSTLRSGVMRFVKWFF